MLSPNVIIPLDDTHANIPSGFSRETDLDSKLICGYGAEAVTTTGGATTHTHSFNSNHTINSHTHTFTTNGAYDNGSGFNDEGSEAGGKGVDDNHTHSGTTNGPSTGSITEQFVSGSASSFPPYYDVVFIKSIGFRQIPVNGIIWRPTNSRATLTQHSASSGKFFRGAATGGNAGGTGGALTHSHDVGHQHAAVTHYHSATSSVAGPDRGGNSSAGGSNTAHGHPFNFPSASDTPNAYSGTMGTAETVQPVYKTLCPFKNATANPVTVIKGDIALTLGALPAGWLECNGSGGTTDMTNFFVKNYAGSATTNDGTGAGANTHSHAAANTHTHTANSSHTHGTANTGSVAVNYLDGAGSAHVAPVGHTHTATINQSQTTGWATATMALDANSDTRPPYRRVRFIQFDHDTFGGAAIFASTLNL